MSAFLINWPAAVFICLKPPGAVKQFCRFRIWSSTQCITPVYALHTTRSPLPPCYTLYKYITLYLFTQGRGEGGWGWMRTSEKVRGALVHKRGRKYQHDWLYLLSINSIKHQWRRHLWFGVFIVIWSMMASLLQHRGKNCTKMFYWLRS